MTPLSQLGRLLRITRVFVRHDLDEFVRALHLFRPYRRALRAVTLRWFPRRAHASARAAPARGARRTRAGVHQVRADAGPRPDLLPDDIAMELGAPPGPVPPFPGEDAESIVAAALGAPSDEPVPPVRHPAGRLGLGGAGALRRAARRQPRSRSRCCAPASNTPSNAIWRCCIRSRAWPSAIGRRRAACGRARW